MKLLLGSTIAGLAAIGLFAHVAFAQAPAPATFGETYMALALSIVSLAGNVFNAYLSQKAKLTGQAPNTTDIKIAQGLADLNQRLVGVEGKAAQTIDFLYNNAVPEKAQAIIEGSLPLIKVQAVNNDVRKAETKFNQAVELVKTVEEGAAKTKPIEKV
jgi:hypothetical protein